MKILHLFSIPTLLVLAVLNSCTSTQKDLTENQYKSIKYTAVVPAGKNILKLDPSITSLLSMSTTAKDSLKLQSDIQFLNFSNQKDEFKYNLTLAPGTLVKLINTDPISNSRTFQSIGNVTKAGLKIESKAPQNTEVDEQIIDSSKKFELNFIIGNASLKREERFQFLKQDILYASISDTMVDNNLLTKKLKSEGTSIDANNYWIITEAILQSFTYKKFFFLGRNGRIRIPLSAATIESEASTYKQTSDFKNTLVVRIVVRPAFAYTIQD